jgi:hypothetical protein
MSMAEPKRAQHMITESSRCPRWSVDRGLPLMPLTSRAGRVWPTRFDYQPLPLAHARAGRAGPDMARLGGACHVRRSQTGSTSMRRDGTHSECIAGRPTLGAMTNLHSGTSKVPGILRRGLAVSALTALAVPIGLMAAAAPAQAATINCSGWWSGDRHTAAAYCYYTGTSTTGQFRVKATFCTSVCSVVYGNWTRINVGNETRFSTVYDSRRGAGAVSWEVVG